MKFVIKLLKNLRETERVLVITQLWNMSKPCFNLPSKTLYSIFPTLNTSSDSRSKSSNSSNGQSLMSKAKSSHATSGNWPGPSSGIRCPCQDAQSEDLMKQMVRVGWVSVYCKIGPGNQWWMVPKMFQNICCIKCWNVFFARGNLCQKKLGLETAAKNWPLHLAIHQFNGKSSGFIIFLGKVSSFDLFSHCSHQLMGTSQIK